MNKQQFIKHIKELIRIKKEMDRVEDVIKTSPLNDNLSVMTLGSSYYEDLVLKILKDAMDDQFNWIDYFIYEMDMKFSKSSVGRENKNKLYIRNFDDLYNLIIK